MDAFCIGSSVLGTERNLCCEKDGFRWSDDVPEGYWHLTGAEKHSDFCLDTAFRLARVSPAVAPDEKFVRMMNSFSGSLSGEIPWAKVMPLAAHKGFTKGIISSVVDNHGRLPLDYLKGAWKAGTAVLDKLQRPRVDEELVSRLIEERVGNVHVVKTFSPESDGRAPAVSYNRFGTLTGRMTIETGPSILTLKREYRKLIRPEDGHELLSIDFAAMEARVVLYESGKRCDDQDIYGSIAAELQQDRNVVKGAIISELYGMGRELLGKRLNMSGSELDGFITRIKRHFNTKGLFDRIKSGFIKDGHITNRYGRPVFIDEPLDYVLMNYYVQSTGNDVVMQGFLKLLNKFESMNLGCVPYYVLHDALLLSVPKEHVESIKRITKITVDGYVQPFFLKTDVIA